MPEQLSIETIFSETKNESRIENTGNSINTSSAVNSSVSKPIVIPKKKKEDIGTPSISQALSGVFKNEVAEKVMVPESYARQTREIDLNFTQEQLLEVWPEFAGKYSTQVHLFNTLSIKPVLIDNFKIKIIVENSVQQDQLRMLKPEMIGFLIKNLKNTKIDVIIEMGQMTHEKQIFTDDQKILEMMKKNPVLQKMKTMFNLDFNG